MFYCHKLYRNDSKNDSKYIKWVWVFIPRELWPGVTPIKNRKNKKVFVQYALKQDNKTDKINKLVFALLI